MGAIQDLSPIQKQVVFRDFADGKPAILWNSYKKGYAVLFGFFPGCASMQKVIPRRPFDRGTSDNNFNHFLATNFHSSAAAAVLIMPMLNLGRVTYPRWWHAEAFDPEGNRKDQAFDLTVIDAPGGMVVPIANYSGKEFKEVTVTVRTKDEFKRIYAARAGELKAKREGETLTVKLPLGWADMIVFRK